MFGQYPFAIGLRRWLSWMLGDVVRQLSACFSGGGDDARLFLRNFVTGVHPNMNDWYLLAKISYD